MLLPDDNKDVMCFVKKQLSDQPNVCENLLRNCKDYGTSLGNRQKEIAGNIAVNEIARVQLMIVNYLKVLKLIRDKSGNIVLFVLALNNLVLLRDKTREHGISSVVKYIPDVEIYIQSFEKAINKYDEAYKTNIRSIILRIGLSFATCWISNWDYQFQYDRTEPLQVTQVKRMTNYLGQEITVFGNLCKIILQLRGRVVLMDNSNYSKPKERKEIEKKIKGIVIECDMHCMTKPFAKKISMELREMMLVGDKCRFVHGIGKNSVDKFNCKLVDVKEIFTGNEFNILPGGTLRDGTPLGEFKVEKIQLPQFHSGSNS